MGERRFITGAFHGGSPPREKDPRGEEKKMAGGMADPGSLGFPAAS